MADPLRVLVVDDSAFMRRLITSILAAEPDICIVGQARNGKEAINFALEQAPNVITMDVEMPVLDGYQALEVIMKSRPTPVVMLSSLTKAGAEATIRCLQLGAVDVIAKPSGPISLDLDKISAEILTAVRAAALSRVSRRAYMPSSTPRLRHSSPCRSKCIFIGSSTGGPRALQQVIPKLPGNLGAPVVIVQHMPAGFTQALADRINGESAITVRQAEQGDRLEANTALVAPGGLHMAFGRHGLVELSDGPAVNGVKPSADVTLTSLVRTFAGEMTGVLLTGMGRDGAVALKLLRDAGGRTLVESEETCVVFGMPRAAVELGAAELVLPIHEIAPEISRTVRPTSQP